MGEVTLLLQQHPLPWWPRCTLPHHFFFRRFLPCEAATFRFAGFALLFTRAAFFFAFAGFLFFLVAFARFRLAGGGVGPPSPGVEGAS
jgi:hypothetical protein